MRCARRRPQPADRRSGRQLARLPVDPRLARMVVEADRRGCLREVLVIAAALSIQDPRERPVEQPGARRPAARALQRPDLRLPDLLNLWRYLRSSRRALLVSAFRRMCRAEHLNYLRVREWQDLESQLRQVAKQLELDVGQAGRRQPGRGRHPPGAAVRAALARRAARPGASATTSAPAARGSRSSPAPGCSRSSRSCVMAAELVETSRLYARRQRRDQAGVGRGARRAPGQAHLLRAALVEEARRRCWPTSGSRCTACRWSPTGGGLRQGRPGAGAELFIRHALVYGEWHTRHAFFARNRALLEEAEELEHRARRRGIVVDEHTLFDFYDARVGARRGVRARTSTPGGSRPADGDPDLLTFDPAMLVTSGAEESPRRTTPTSGARATWRCR